MPKRAKRSGPVHQNHTEYVHLRNCKRNAPEEKVFGAMHGGMCKRCRDIMDWKRKFGKWKIMSAVKQEARTCTNCHEKTVFHPFAHICKTCCKSLKECAKCRQPETEDDPLGRYPLTITQRQSKVAQDKKRMTGMTEREKRTLLRQEAKAAAERAEAGEEPDDKYMYESTTDEEGSDDDELAGDFRSRCSVKTGVTRISHWNMHLQEQELPKRTRTKQYKPAADELELGEISEGEEAPPPIKAGDIQRPADYTDSDEEVL